jgi:hypothetical protein
MSVIVRLREEYASHTLDDASGDVHFTLRVGLQENRSDSAWTSSIGREHSSSSFSTRLIRLLTGNIRISRASNGFRRSDIECRIMGSVRRALHFRMAS